MDFETRKVIRAKCEKGTTNAAGLPCAAGVVDHITSYETDPTTGKTREVAYYTPGYAPNYNPDETVEVSVPLYSQNGVAGSVPTKIATTATGADADDGPNYSRSQVAGASALLKNGVALGLDGFSLLTDFVGPEAQYAKLLLGLGLSSTSIINSAAAEPADLTGIGLGGTSYFKTTAEFGATSTGLKSTKWFSGTSLILDGYSLKHDYTQMMKDYQDCMEKY